MSLSEQEQRALREIEQSLFAEDPKFGSSVAQPTGFGPSVATGKVTMRSAALLVLGLVLLIGGVALAALNIWAVVLSLVGFGVMMLGGIMALRTPATAVTQPAFGTQSPRPRPSSFEEGAFSLLALGRMCSHFSPHRRPLCPTAECNWHFSVYGRHCYL